MDISLVHVWKKDLKFKIRHASNLIAMNMIPAEISRELIRQFEHVSRRIMTVLYLTWFTNDSFKLKNIFESFYYLFDMIMLN